MKIINKEVDIYTRYILTKKPSDIIIKKYNSAIKVLIKSTSPKTNFENLILEYSIKNIIFLEALDSFTKIFDKSNVLQIRLHIIFAIIETDKISYDYFLKSNKSFLIEFIYFLLLIARFCFFIFFGFLIYTFIKYIAHE